MHRIQKLTDLIENEFCSCLWGELEIIQVPNIWQKFYMEFPYEIVDVMIFLQNENDNLPFLPKRF
jgi:hypothetical protein